MKRMIPLILILAVLLLAMPATAAAVGNFTDVSDSDYYARAVAWALAWGVTNGTSDTTFSPELTCTRAQVTAFLWHALERPEPEEAPELPFTDVPTGIYYYKAVRWAYACGVVAGSSETSFSPNAPCTRAQIVTILWRAFGSE